MILLINSETSNLGAWISILNKLNEKFVLSDSKNWKPENIKKIIFPGIGNFEEVIKNISKNKLREKIIYMIQNKIPYLGVCVGMQALFANSEESNNKTTTGLDLIRGKVLKIYDKNIILPHNGWNDIKITKKKGIFKDIKTGTDFYFNHSYYCKCDSEINITSILKDHKEIISSVEQDNIFGVQFHPEKSMASGVKIIKNFIEMKC